MKHKALIAVLLTGGAICAASAAAAVTANLQGSDGENLGIVTFTGTPNGVLLRAELKGLPPGTHGFHVHETGACSPDFEAAGEHLAGDAEAHGFKAAEDPHAGDLPNIHVPESGELTVEVFNTALSLTEGPGALLDEDGAAVIIHGDADDYESQPSGEAGDRIACGVIEQ